MKSIIFILSMLVSFATFAQDKITSWEAAVNTDSLLMGNQLKISFTLKNARANNFKAPSFSNFDLLMGPSQSSSMSVINGDVTQETTYSYILRPKEIGNYFIDPASIELNGEIIETAPLEIIVFPNPDGIIQEDHKQNLNWEHLPWDPPENKKLKGKKKKKIYKI